MIFLLTGSPAKRDPIPTASFKGAFQPTSSREGNVLDTMNMSVITLLSIIREIRIEQVRHYVMIRSSIHSLTKMHLLSF